jgi:hypothetical protein
MSAGRQADPALVERIQGMLREPVYFRDVLAAMHGQSYRAILLAWSDIRSSIALERDELGRYWIEKN